MLVHQTAYHRHQYRRFWGLSSFPPPALNAARTVILAGMMRVRAVFPESAAVHFLPRESVARPDTSPEQEGGGRERINTNAVLGCPTK